MRANGASEARPELASASAAAEISASAEKAGVAGGEATVATPYASVVPATKYSTELGWGCISNVVATVLFKSGSSAKANFDQCNAL